MSTPFFDLIEELRALGGAPKVTYPTGNNSYPQTERTLKVPRGSETLALGSAEPDATRFPSNILTEQITLRMDAQYVEVYRKYEVLPGPFTKQGQEYDPEYGFLAEWTEGEVKNGVAIGTALSDVEPENYVKSSLKTYTVPTAALNAFYLTFPGMGEIELPKVLTGIDITWDTTSGTGAFSETGSGAAVGSNANLSLNAQGRGQGSASVLADIAPIFAPQPPARLPILDLFFFLPNPVTRAQILTGATAFATIIYGGATTVNDWPLFLEAVHTFIITGQKVSVSGEATARVSVSLAASDTSYAVSTGSGTNQDFGSTVRAITLPSCIHGLVPISGPTSNTSSTGSTAATAYIDLGSPAIAGSATPIAPMPLTTAAAGSVSPNAVQPTPVPSYPAYGIYMYESNVSPFKWGYSAVRVRLFDFGILALKQITIADFTGLTGASFVTGAAGKAFIIPTPGNQATGVWFQTGTESQPDLSAYSVNAYTGITINSASAASDIAQAVSNTFIGGVIWAVTFSGPVVTFTALNPGRTPGAADIDTGADIYTLQFGAP